MEWDLHILIDMTGNMMLTYLFVVEDRTCVNTKHAANETNDNLYANVEKLANADSQKPPEVRLL